MNNCTYTAQGFLTCPSTKNKTYEKETFAVQAPQAAANKNYDGTIQYCDNCTYDNNTCQRGVCQMSCKCKYCGKNDDGTYSAEQKYGAIKKSQVNISQPIFFCGNGLQNKACDNQDAFQCYNTTTSESTKQ